MEIVSGKKLAGGSHPQELERLLRKGKEEIVPHVPWSEDKAVGKERAGCWEAAEPHAGRYLYRASRWGFFCRSRWLDSLPKDRKAKGL